MSERREKPQPAMWAESELPPRRAGGEGEQPRPRPRRASRR